MRVPAGLILVLAMASLPGARAAPPYEGRPLGAVLEELRHGGLNIIYSSAVVRLDLVVVAEPEATDPRVILDQILAPLDLQADDGGRGTILIVPRPPRVRAPTPAGLSAAPSARDSRLVERIVVTPGQHKIVPQDVTGRRSLSGQDVLAAPTLGSDPIRVVTLLPGIAAADGSAAFNARGSAAKDVALILDGLELYDPFHLSGLRGPFSFVDGRMVDAVDFLGGGFTADRGDRNGGFLAMSSSTSPEHAGGEVEVGTLNSRFAYEGPSPLGGLLVSARYWYPEAVGDAVPFGVDGLRPGFSDLYAKLALAENSRTLVTAHFLAASDRASLNESDGRERVQLSNRSGYLWVRALRAWTDRVTTDSVVAAGRIDRDRYGVAEPADVAVAVTDERRARFFELRNDVTWSISGSRVVKGGVDLHALDADLRYVNEASGNPASISLAPSGVSIGAYGAFKTAISERLTGEFGLRWDRQTYTGDRQWSPRVNLAWQASERSEVRMSAGRYAQSMRIHELRIEDGQTAYGPPELSRQLDVAFLHRFTNRWNFRVDVYSHHFGHLQPHYENLYHPVELFPEVEPDRVLVAPESAELRGAELSLHGDPTAPLSFWGSYVWSSAKDVIDGVEVPRSWDQTHAGTILLAYRWVSGWFLSGSGTVHTGWPTTPSDGSRNSARFPTYARFDLKTGRTIPVRKGSLRVELSVVNLTDQKNPCCVDEFAPDGRPVYNYWLGITPSLQAVWRY